MTGNLRYYSSKDVKPAYSRVTFHFKEGEHLHYLCKRKLGRIEIDESTNGFRKRHDIGKDAMSITRKEFVNLLDGKRGGIKSALMNQKLISGIGNVYSDEILYQCKIHPKMKVRSLCNKQIERLYHAMQEVLHMAIKKDANPSEMPTDYLIMHRSEEDDCPNCGGPVTHIKVSGRGCYICPKCQML